MRRLIGFLAALFVAAVGYAQTEEICDVIYEINAPPTVAATHTILSTTHSDTDATAPTDGQVLAWNAGIGKWKATDAAAGGSGAPTDATYIVQTANGSLSAEQALGALGTGLVLNTTTTGVLSIYGGATCTNQFVRVLSASGAATCASIANADITAATIDLTTKVTGVLPVAKGGTGTAFFTVSGPASTAKTYTFPNASSTVLTSNAAVTVAQGGTGLASGTSGGVPYYSGSTTIASSAALTQYGVVIGGGAGAAPTVIAVGTTGQCLTGVTGAAPVFATCGSLSSQANNTMFGNVSGSSGNPSVMTVPQAGRLLGIPSAAPKTTLDIWDELNKGYVNSSTAYGGSTIMGNSVISGTATTLVSSNGVAAGSHTWVDGNHPGVPECVGGTATADTCWMLQGIGTSNASGSWIWTPGLAVEILFHGDTVSDGTDTYTVFLGSTSTAVTTAIGVVNSVYASYTHSANSGNFVMNTCKASTCTTGNTATAYPGSAWQHVLMYVDAAGTGLHFSFGCTTPENPTACADATNSPIATTNIPVVAQHLAFGIVKTAGTAVRSLALDYVHIYMIPGSDLAR